MRATHNASSKHYSLDDPLLPLSTAAQLNQLMCVVHRIGCDVVTVILSTLFSIALDVDIKLPNSSRALSKFHFNPVVVMDSQGVPNGIKPHVGPSNVKSG